LEDRDEKGTGGIRSGREERQGRRGEREEGSGRLITSLCPEKWNSQEYHFLGFVVCENGLKGKGRKRVREIEKRIARMRCM
jgi:hypothetical protein